MDREGLLKLYDRLTALVSRLPGGLQKPILRELDPIREHFLEQRPARIALVGAGGGPSVPAIIADLCGIAVSTGESSAGWRKYSARDRGTVEIFDGRADTPDALFDSAASQTPDLVVVVDSGQDAGGLSAATARAAAFSGTPRVAGVALTADGAARLASALAAEAHLASRSPLVFSVPDQGWRDVAESLCALLPNPARLEFARLAAAKRAQAEIAGTLLKSFTAVCGVIAVQPIPLADLPILTALQGLMVGLIVYVSGRPASARLVAEFGGAMGINVGLGFAFREGARALLKIFPLWGNAISGVVAGAGTYAIGRAAIAYFIEDLPLKETRKLFSRLRRKPAPSQNARLK